MPRQSLQSWDDYRAAVREFDAVLEHAKAVSASLVGKDAPSTNVSYAEQILVKALSHCLVIRQLVPDPMRMRPQELWDVSSISAIARCVIDAHDAFFYVAAMKCTADEAGFRVLLWEAHDKTRRTKMLKAIGSSNPRNSQLFREADEYIAKLIDHAFFGAIRKDLQKKIRESEPPAYHLSQREMCAAAEIDHDYYTAITMQLSQHIHTYPFSVRQLFAFKAGSLDSVRLMALPMQYTIPFLARITECTRSLFPGLTPEPPSRTARSMALWRAISTNGLKSAA